jgi:hypothetical protein
MVASSGGSAIAIQESATHRDISLLIVTGFLHTPHSGWITMSAFLFHASLGPQFAGDDLAPGYLTAIPGDRGVFDSGCTDLCVVSYDEDHKDLMTSAELTTAVSSLTALPPLNVSDGVTVPVLIVVGQPGKLPCQDPVPDCASPASVRDFGLPYYQAAPSLTVDTVPGTGHDLATEPSANQSFTVINDWIGVR